MAKKLVIFASGAGSNVANILSHFRSVEDTEIIAVLSNKKEAGALQIAAENEVQAIAFNRADLEGAVVADKLRELNPDLIVLAGFLLKVPEHLTSVFANKIINVHPSLLPKFGGKGMYGIHVHRAVVEAQEKESGITIHFVNEHYDEGNIIAQFNCAVLDNDTPETLQDKIKELEKTYFPKVIEKLLIQQDA